MVPVPCWHQGKSQQSCHWGKTSSKGQWWGSPVITQDGASPLYNGTSSTSFGTIYFGLLLLNNIALVFLFLLFLSREKKHYSQTLTPAVCFPSPWTTGLILALSLFHPFLKVSSGLFWESPLMFVLSRYVWIFHCYRNVAFVRMEIVNATQNTGFWRPWHCRPYKIFKSQNLYIKFILTSCLSCCNSYLLIIFKKNLHTLTNNKQKLSIAELKKDFWWCLEILEVQLV